MEQPSIGHEQKYLIDYAMVLATSGGDEAAKSDFATWAIQEVTGWLKWKLLGYDRNLIDAEGEATSIVGLSIESFLKAVAKGDVHTDSWQHFFFKICSNEGVNYGREMRRQQLLQNRVNNNFAKSAELPVETIVALADVVEAVRQKLSPQQQYVIYLKECEQYTFEEIDEVLNLRPHRSQTIYYTARERIQRHLNG